MRILLTNDDGIKSVGIRALYQAFKKQGYHVDCVAPSSEMSAVSHALTMHTPLRVMELNKNDFHGFGVTGTPVDCVKLAIRTLLPHKPDLVVSGINSGANVGVDILYSGTVSAAREAALMGIPSLAVSFDNYAPIDLAEQADYVTHFIEKKPWEKNISSCVLNLNLPDCPIKETKGLRLCKPAQITYEDGYEKRVDPRGRSYYWLIGEFPHQRLAPNTDRELLNRNYITLTPLHLELTNEQSLQCLQFLEDN